MSNLKLGGAGLKGGRVQAYSDKQVFPTVSGAATVAFR
jgi:hypothetical protein